MVVWHIVVYCEFTVSRHVMPRICGLAAA